MLHRFAQGWVKSESGTTAVEVALVLPAFAMLIVGTLSACLLVFSNASLHYAAEQGARCYSVNAGQCGSAAAAQVYAKAHYAGIGSPIFAAATPACGHQVTGTVTISLNAALKSWSVPLSATACFP